MNFSDINYINVIFLLLMFGVMFGVTPNFAYNQVKKLLTYHNYRKEAFKKRFIKVVRVYFILGLTLGFVLAYLLGNGSIGNLDFKNNTIDLITFSFLISFSLVMIIRITTLLHFPKLFLKILPRMQKIKFMLKIKKYDYKELKAETVSFLFSLFLMSLLSFMVYFCYNLLLNESSMITFTFITNYGDVRNYILFMLLFFIILIFLTIIGELLLNYVGVRPNCKEDANG